MNHLYDCNYLHQLYHGGVALLLRMLMSRSGVAGWVWEGRQSALLRGENFLKQGLPVHSEQIGWRVEVDTGLKWNIDVF